jgi:perosamine synthetase
MIVVHYGGCPADMDGITAVARRHGIPLVEDAAEALGASYRGKPVGGFGKAAMFSFTPTKVITTGEGGILTTDDGDLASRLRLLKNHGQDRLYHHVLFGFNYRMTEMQGAIGLAQMSKINSIIESKRRVAEKISVRLSGIKAIRLPLFEPEYFCTYMLYTIAVPCRELREGLAAELERNDIATRIYFPPVHQQPVFSANGRPRLPVTEKLGETSLTLPCFASMTEEEITYMTDCIKTFFGNRNEDYSDPA